VPKNIELAEPNFNIPRKINMLFVAEWFIHLMVEVQIQSTLVVPVVQYCVRMDNIWWQECHRHSAKTAFKLRPTLKKQMILIHNLKNFDKLMI